MPRAIFEEDAAQLKLGPEFENEDMLTVSEAKILIETVLAQRARETNGEIPMTDVMKKTVAYFNVFARFKTAEATYACERILGNRFHKFERAQLGTLCCEDAEEARTLIPSLANKIDDQNLQGILDELSTLRKFQD
ncbi:DNA-directed RNA polymerase II subunit rpb4 [Schizosaccharomyces pombe]|uniref:DNA-directed RNA polymerase II subunit rpb4 n=1 Tax=Schizosaccharomyces pombe (strain 972 / ATCC 24843) TaxID=284812 RepID=RPB4_SCHPO|nr:DNA-directed RNA polymerase II complex subunit Rpb4 [Schizosaccharomyces pombe]O74825.1 RecName: Full=DNA-directed RNA polymerase II subunit rpb4; Short=RNA polymerase II subunit B4 [Schizosaccharomyces pombe 972h-]3H0G_D Chain D, DNA-directed RNA polymerase II subunit rpb4 [Schizosaccharomyces pombe 972h-]3H0G_P Chain P, DNA-directed RNA polymerase II subunit rpb4 [Schizosaccharomyces pombe 972h-]5U0S_d Chain d, RNA polymerase II subunit Rpb4 [Schizosaccharomyces pombe]AAF62856.1 RNA polym|eukprot:NP_595415.1 DNA-directed RNA polymerase II complex subunit Rpb4 [Schizosaccharomyces pombe]